MHPVCHSSQKGTPAGRPAPPPAGAAARRSGARPRGPARALVRRRPWRRPAPAAAPAPPPAPPWSPQPVQRIACSIYRLSMITEDLILHPSCSFRADVTGALGYRRQCSGSVTPCHSTLLSLLKISQLSEVATVLSCTPSCPWRSGAYLAGALLRARQPGAQLGAAPLRGALALRAAPWWCTDVISLVTKAGSVRLHPCRRTHACR